MREIVDFIKGMLSGNGVQSFARGGCMFIIYFKVCESLYIVSATKVMPDIPGNWAMLITGLYGLSKGIDSIMAKVEATKVIAVQQSADNVAVKEVENVGTTPQ
jgi:hypothetical protein